MPTLTVRLDEALDRELSELAHKAGRGKSDLVREMLQRQTTLERFRQARKTIVPAAEKAGYLTDEDVFRDVS